MSTAEKKTPETWGAAKKIPAWKTRVASAFANWPAGFMVTERDYDETIARAFASRIVSSK